MTRSIQILRLLGKNKIFQKWIAKHRTILAQRGFYVSAIMAAFKKGIALEEAQKYEEAKKSLCADKDLTPIRQMLNHEYADYLNYIGAKRISHRLYLDYLRACNYLGLDMTIERNRFPHDFHRWHDIRIDEYNSKKAAADKEKRKEIYTKFASVAEKYLPLQKEKDNVYIVLIAKSPAELMQEGNALHHCVGSYGYDQKFVREETLIFFIRNAKEPNVPFVTVEYSLRTQKILQCYADHNQTPEPEVTDFVNKKWLPYAKRQLKKIAA